LAALNSRQSKIFKLAANYRSNTVAGVNSQSPVLTISWILVFLLIPGSFFGAYYTVRNFVKNLAAVVLLTFVLAAIYFIAGTCAIFAGCSALT